MGEESPTTISATTDSKKTGTNANKTQDAKKKMPWNKSKGGKPNNNSKTDPKKRFQGGIAGLEDHYFYYGKGMNVKLVTTKEKILIYIGKKYTMSESASLQAGKPKLIAMKHPDKLKKAQHDALEFWEQEQWKNKMKRYDDAMASVHKNLSSCYAIIWDQMTNPLKNKLKADDEFRIIEEEKDACKLWTLISKICNKVTSIDDFSTRLFDSLYSIIELTGNKMSLSDYYDHFVERRKQCKASGIEFNTDLQRTALKDRFTKEHGSSSADYSQYVTDLDHHCNEQMYALMFMRMAGDRFAECRREINNDFTKGTDHIPRSVDEAYSLLQNYEGSSKYIQSHIKNNNGSRAQSSNSSNETEDTNYNSKAKFPGHSFQQQEGFP